MIKMVTRQVTITLDEDVVHWLDQAARKLGLSRSAVIQMSIKLSYDLKMSANRQIRREMKKYLKQHVREGSS